MNTPYHRSIKSSTLTLMEYQNRIRSILGSENNFYSDVQKYFSPHEREQILEVIGSLESNIEKFWKEYEYGKDNVDEQWGVWVLAEAMENLVHDMELKRLSKTYGKIESEAERKRISALHEDLHTQIQLLKKICSGEG